MGYSFANEYEKIESRLIKKTIDMNFDFYGKVFLNQVRTGEIWVRSYEEVDTKEKNNENESAQSNFLI